jgi:hypothetical protein
MENKMTFEQLMAKAAEEANEHELIAISVNDARAYLDSNENTLEDFDSAIDWAQGAVHSGEKPISWILIKITK